MKYLRRPMQKAELELDYVVLGSSYGCWPVIPGLLNGESAVVSVGIGEDISFDIALIEHLGCDVHAYDPTPRSQDWLLVQNLPTNFKFYPVGLSNTNGILTFYAPAKKEYVSFTQNSSRASSEKINLPVKTLSTIAADLRFSSIDYLKIDIEGSEYDVIPDLIENGPLPNQLCIEFHHLMKGYSKSQTRLCVNKLRECGYKIFYVSSNGREYGFVNQSLVALE